jgi:putative ABC transport system ATP-binding protein
MPPTAIEKERPAFDSLFAYIWRHSRVEQIAILSLVLASMPFYYVSLDLPKAIVNDAIQGKLFAHGRTVAKVFQWDFTWPSVLGGATWHILPGVELGRLAYLFWLSGAFLVLVLINNAFKYVINMQKGKLGERILQGLRLELFSLLLRFTPESLRNVKSSEVATIIRDEVEPIGGFVGDAFVAPVFLGGQALTALVFILIQSPSLGGLAAGMVLIQGVVIPRLRREQLRLGRQRQLQSRYLAGRVGEIVDGMAEVDNHGTAGYERYRISLLLNSIFWIRYRLYGRKFMVKFINNMLAQITPFLFYAIGGYYAVTGSLDIGQLVAVIAAYRDLPPPVRDLIDWDQTRLDVEVKYVQIVEQFSGGELSAAPSQAVPPFASGTIDVQGLRVAGTSGEVLIDGANLSLPLGSHAALLAMRGDGASVLAQVIGRRIGAYSGSVRIGGQDLSSLTGPAVGARLTYAGPEAVVFQGSIRDNTLYGLRNRENGNHPLFDRSADLRGEIGAPMPGDEWIDFAGAGAHGLDDIDARIVEVLGIVDMDEAIYRFGLAQKIDPQHEHVLANRFVEARNALRVILGSRDMLGLIEPFDPARFNRNATISENLVFGVADESVLTEGRIADHPFVRGVLDEAGLTLPLLRMGLKIAALTVEIFTGLSPDHFLFEQYSFISPDNLASYGELAARAQARGEQGLSKEDWSKLIGLSLVYVEPRHRLDLLTPEIADATVQARQKFMSAAPHGLRELVEFYDPEHYCAAAPLRDNLLFGRIAHGMPGAAERVLGAVRRVIADMGLDRDVYRIGLDHQAGPAGRLLFPTQRSAIALARCLIKRPDILILNQAFAAFGDVEGRTIIDRIRRRMEGKTLIVVTRDAELAATFDVVFTVQDGKIKPMDAARAPVAVHSVEDEEGGSGEQVELRALRAVPMFADMETPRLKLIAFASERQMFGTGQIVFRQGAASDAAYVVLDGKAKAQLDTEAGPLELSEIGAGSIIGEMGVINGRPRSATIVAVAPLTVLRLPREILLGLIAEFPQIALSLMRDQINRTVAAEARLARLTASQASAAC